MLVGPAFPALLTCFTVCDLAVSLCSPRLSPEHTSLPDPALLLPFVRCSFEQSLEVHSQRGAELVEVDVAVTVACAVCDFGETSLPDQETSIAQFANCTLPRTWRRVELCTAFLVTQLCGDCTCSKSRHEEPQDPKPEWFVNTPLFWRDLEAEFIKPHRCTVVLQPRELSDAVASCVDLVDQVSVIC